MQTGVDCKLLCSRIDGGEMLIPVVNKVSNRQALPLLKRANGTTDTVLAQKAVGTACNCCARSAE